MTIDSVNEKDLEFSESISYILRQHESFDKDPFIKVEFIQSLDYTVVKL